MGGFTGFFDDHLTMKLAPEPPSLAWAWKIIPKIKKYSAKA